jgi:hypothetical protein
MTGKRIFLIVVALIFILSSVGVALADSQKHNYFRNDWGLWRNPAPAVTPTPTPTRTTTPTPTRTTTPTPTPTPAVGIWKPTADAPIHWQWQIGTQFNTSTDVIPHVTVYDIDAFDTDASTVAYLHSLGFKVIAYVDFGTWENWRPDASSFSSSVLGKSNGWAGEKWLDIRSNTVKQLMAARLDMVKQRGFDAVEPDNIDGWENSTGFPLTAQDQLNYNEWIAAQCHQRGLSVGFKNDVEQAATLQPYFDWALNEECYQYSECDALTAFTNANKAVFQVEYSGTKQCSALNALHFNSMTRDLDLVSPRTSGYKRVPCIPDTQNTW